MIDRAAIRREAKTWLGTPWRHCAAIKGVGVDCAQLIFKVLQVCGLIDPGLELSGYSPQHHLHRRDEVFQTYVEMIAYELPSGNRHLADIVLYRFGKVFNHGGIVIDWPVVIHATQHVGTVLDDVEKLTVSNTKPSGVKYYRLRDSLKTIHRVDAKYIREKC